MSSRIASANAGVMRYQVQFVDGSSAVFVGKRKTSAIIAKGIGMAGGGNLRLILELLLHHKVIGYQRSAIREAVLYQETELLPKDMIPVVYDAVTDWSGGRCFFMMEELPLSQPPCQHVYAIADRLASFHASYLGTEKPHPILNVYTPLEYHRASAMFSMMFQQLEAENRILFTKTQLHTIEAFCKNLGREAAAVASRKTFTHNDCCVRNICISGERIVFYDWELACWQNPEHDIIELLISMLHQLPQSEVLAVLQYYRRRMEQFSGVSMTNREYKRYLRFNTLEFCINKLSILRLAGKKLHLSLPSQLAENTSGMMQILEIGTR
ncbi:MAG: aminoglycoside phosphotransferase family protein [Oscillospiraceae bacterium]|nr:aminoglycoside phosphotransferase family protein [Oscillospiraceae bacterium]